MPVLSTINKMNWNKLAWIKGYQKTPNRFDLKVVDTWKREKLSKSPFVTIFQSDNSIGWSFFSVAHYLQDFQSSNLDWIPFQQSIENRVFSFNTAFPDIYPANIFR